MSQHFSASDEAQQGKSSPARTPHVALNRRQFIQLLGIISSGWSGASLAMSKPQPISELSYYANLAEPWLTLASVQQHLFPADDSSPGAEDIMAIRFLQNILEAPDTDSEHKKFILNGVDWLNQLSVKQYQTTFLQLEDTAKETLLRRVETSKAGSRWLSSMLTYLIEALLSDPVYGGNKDAIGWNWLQHIPGFPTPQAHQVYFKLTSQANSRRRTKA